MATPEELIRKLNRVTRHLNDAAVEVAPLKSELKLDVIPILVSAISEVIEALHTLFAQHPHLEYHFDPDREPTEFMRRVQQLAEDAEKALASGSKSTAIDKLQEALSLEPPSLAYEVLEKRRDEILKIA